VYVCFELPEAEAQDKAKAQATTSSLYYKTKELSGKYGQFPKGEVWNNQGKTLYSFKCTPYMGMQLRGNRRYAEGIKAQPEGGTSHCLKGNKSRAKRQEPTLPGMGLPLKSSSRSWMSRPLDTSISLGGFWNCLPETAVRNLLRATGDTVGPMDANPPSGSL